MAVAIDAELLEFKSKVGGALGTMQTTVSTLSSKLSNLSSLADNTSSSISSVYNSKNKDIVLSKFAQIKDIYNKISTSLESDLSVILSGCQSLIDKITRLEEILKAIAEQEDRIKNAGPILSYSDDDSWSKKREIDSHNAKVRAIISDAEAIIAAKEAEFKSLHEEAKSDLSKLKSMDSSISFVSEFAAPDVNALSKYYTGGELVKQTYTASNGVKIDYFLYVPEYSTDVTNLPVHLYLHGAGEFSGNKTLTTSLPKQIKDGVIKPNGIVICPQGNSSMTKNGYWRNADYSAALIELTNNVVSTHNADSNRISISGHSQGAISGFKIISDNPGYFSAFVPVSGHSERVKDTPESWEALRDVDIWAFHGETDDDVDYYKIKDAMAKIEENGSDNMELYTFDGRGHSIQNDVYSSSYEREDGSSYNPLDWALQQRNDD